ncbi:MAG: protein kinase [Phycisphaerales bacterium]
MSLNRVSRIKDLFDEALRADPIGRAELLERASRAEPDGEGIVAEVRVLLAELESAGGFLEAAPGAAEALARTIVADAGIQRGIGDWIGPYHLLEQIGEGGFGVVYLAEQEHPIRRRVALKIIKMGMDTKQVISRFEQERQALALMDHPSIAKVLDAGATATGRPFFVMELVPGEPVTQFCNNHRLGLRARLELFSRICEAVQHAHQRGIIHRDLKPSNILVSLDDGERPAPKVIDFGIAKATESRLTERTVFTESRQLIGTPEYMSPEQAGQESGGGIDIDTRTDVYSLGVLLYELLIGVTPFDSRRLRSAAFDELCRLIREVEPPRPSTRLSTIETIGEIAAQRQTEPAHLRSAVRGELDWIVMRCIEKDRTRRYASAADLGRDVWRHLNHEPLEAGPPTAAYRVRKFIRRHRREVAVATVLLVTLILGLIGTSTGALWALRARNAAVKSERRALNAAEAETAERKRADSTAKEATELAYRLAMGLAAVGKEQGSIAQARAALTDSPPELRGWEWSHLTWACDQTTGTLDTPPDTSFLTLSGDAARLFALTRAGEVRVYSTSTGSAVQTFHTHLSAVWKNQGPQANQDGSRLITCQSSSTDGWSGPGVTTLWDVASGQPVWSESTSSLLGASFTNGRWRRTPEGAVRVALDGEEILDRVVYSGERIQRVYGPIGDSRSVLLWLEGTGWLVLWDLESQREISRFGGYTIAMLPVEPCGLVAATDDRVNQIDARSGVIQRLPVPIADVVSIRQVGKYAYGIESRQGVIRTFAWPTNEPLFSVDLPLNATGFTVDDLGRIAYCVDPRGATHVREFASSQPFTVTVTNRGGYKAVICPSGRRSAIVGWGSVCVFDTQTGENVWSRYPSRDALYSAAFSSDGRWLAVAGRTPMLTIFDAERGDVRGSFAVPGGTLVTSLAWSHRGDRLLAGLWDGRIIEYDPASPDRAPLEWPDRSAAAVSEISFSADDATVLEITRGGMRLKDHFATCPGTEHMLRIRHSLGDRTVTGTYTATERVRAVVFAPDQSAIVVSADQALVLIDARTARVIRRAETPQPGEALAFSPDGSRFAAVGSDDQLRIVSTADMKLVTSLKCLTWSDGRAVRFTPDGRTVLVADYASPVIAFETAKSDQAERRFLVALARAHVDRAFVQGRFVADRARSSILNDVTIPEPVRAVALDLIAARGDDPNQITNATLLHMPSVRSGPEWLALIEQMQVAVQVLPDDVGLRVTLGITQLRGGQPEQAAATAMKIVDALDGAPQPRLVLAWAILSMARSALNDPERAGAALSQANTVRDSLKDPIPADIAGYLAEAGHLLRRLQPPVGAPR